MTIKEIKKLHNGDEIFWNDPDNGLCSRHLIIQSIEIIDKTDESITIYDIEDDCLQCFAYELS